MKAFTLSEEYLTSVTVYIDYMKDRPEDEQLIAKLKGYMFCSSHTEDHPEFDKLRRELEAEGYIHVTRGSWNGDTVLRSFMFNGAKFKKGEMFPCGAAMAGHLKYIKKS